MTPLTLQFCIAFYVSRDPAHQLGDSYDSSAGKEIKEWMIEERLIEDGNNGTAWGKPTMRLSIFIEHLCAQPLPVQKWIMPETRSPPHD